jgi:RHS repeat-associated protein
MECGARARSRWLVNCRLVNCREDWSTPRGGKYVIGRGSGPAYSVDKATGAVQVSHTDALGSLRALTDASGALIQTYRTDPFGVSTATQGTSTQPFGFTGEPRDAETGLVYLRARMYDPQTGRFPRPDTLAKGASGSRVPNLHNRLPRMQTAGNSPVAWLDRNLKSSSM